jgi:hypothetical protein
VESEGVRTQLTQQEQSFSITRIPLNDCVTQYEENKIRESVQYNSMISAFTGFKKRIFHYCSSQRDEQCIKISSATSNYWVG